MPTRSMCCLLYTSIKGVVRPGRRKMTTDEAKLWTEVSRINTRLKDEMVNAGVAVRALPGDLQEDAINVLSRTVSGMLGDLTAMMAETGEPEWIRPSVYMLSLIHI